MRSLEAIARDLFGCAISWEKDAHVIGNVTAEELAFVVQRYVSACPMCGAEPWCNIDCDLCQAMHKFEPSPRPEAPKTCSWCSGELYVHQHDDHYSPCYHCAGTGEEPTNGPEK